MDRRDFDRWVRGLAGEVSRRGVLKRVAATAAGAPLAALGLEAVAADGNKDPKGNDKKGGGGGNCRGTGQVCSGGQTCCPGLVCGADGRCAAPGATTQSQAQQTTNQSINTNNQVCAGDCAGGQTNTQQTVQGAVQGGGAIGGALFTALPAYTVDVKCEFDAKAFLTTCVGTGRGGDNAPHVRKITLPVADICAEVIDEQTKPSKWEDQVVQTNPAPGGNGGQGGNASAGNGGTANAEANGGAVTVGDVQGQENNVSINASGGTANANAAGGNNNVAIAGGGNGGAGGRAQQQTISREVEPSTLTLKLNGNVRPGRQTTYWLETDAGRLPATGPALETVAEQAPSAGTINVSAAACGIASPQDNFDWFGQCQSPAEPIEFSLAPASGSGSTPAATQSTNVGGRARFGDLQPGTYKLTPNGGTWCHAESDNVDAQGNVVVEAGKESNVWIFTCQGGS